MRASPRRAAQRGGVVFVLSVVLGTAYACGDASTDEATADGGADANVVLPDGAVVTPDGAIVSPDGAIVAPDGAVITPDGSADAGDGGADASDAGIDAPDTGPLSPGYVHADINHVLMTGQSNALANTTTLPRVTTDYANIMFNGGPAVGANPTSFVPLAAGDGGWAAHGMADRISKFALDDFEFGVRPGYPATHDLLVSNNARSGETYWCLRKNGCTYRNPPFAFADGIAHVQKGMAFAAAANKTYVVRGVTTIHGEDEHQMYCGCAPNQPEYPLDGTDGSFRTIKDYTDGILEWQRDYEADIKAITGQTTPIPLFVSQLSGWNDVRYSKAAQFQYLAHKRGNGKVVLIGPSYPFQFFSDCRHFTGASRRQLGEYFAKAYRKMVFEGKTWEPVRPMSVTRAGAVITVKFHVPVPPLAFDTNLVPAIANYGFDFVEDGNIQTIANVTLAGADTVQITLAAAPGAGVKTLRYAQNQVPSTCQGIGSNVGAGPGARGNLRDSDPTTSRYGYNLYNWSVVFEEDVP